MTWSTSCENGIDLDRLGRDTLDILNIVHECEQRVPSITVLEQVNHQKDPQFTDRVA
ncbi:hypothetical protein [Rhizobium sophoriradicis]|uniref:hypothetical protein n=1 Tax=Rhizobium sophoriradicis TaxID=1535245 RepID=UPI0017C33E13